jgi:hypothetical protein
LQRNVCVNRLQQALHELAINKDIDKKQAQDADEIEREIELLRKQLENLETEHKRDQNTISTLEDGLQKARVVGQWSVNNNCQCIHKNYCNT